MKTKHAGILFDQWRPDLGTEFIHHRSEFSKPRFEVQFDETDLPDQYLREYTKKVVITSKFKCNDMDFERCNENAEYRIVQIIREPILKKVNELHTAILNQDRYEAIKISDEIRAICTRGQRGLDRL